MDSFYILYVVITTSIIHVDAEIFPDLTNGSPWKLAPKFLGHVLIIFLALPYTQTFLYTAPLIPHKAIPALLSQ